MKRQVKSGFILLLLFGISFLANAVSTGHVLGRVTEKETGKEVAYANIIFENRMDKIEVQANEYGYYYASHLPTGKYQMRVVFNNRTFFMNQVRVYDSYSNEVNFVVSSDPLLPATVELERKEPIISSVASNDIVLSNSSFNQPTQSLGEALNREPGVNVINGKIFVKGSDQVHFYIDGTPVMGRVNAGKGW
jgi:hypothetical protein